MLDALLEMVTGFSSLEELIAWGGLILLILIVFAETGLMVGFFLPGDSLLFTAGLLVATGVLPISIGVLMLSLILAAIIGDQTGYVTGKYMGRKLFTRPKSRIFNPDHIKRTHAFYEKYGPKTIVLARFVPIIRTFAPIVAGVGQMHYRTFVTYNVVGGIFWVVAMCGAGYWLVRLIPGVKTYLELIIIGIIILSVLPIVHELWKARKKAA